MPLKSLQDAYQQFCETEVCQSNPKVIHNLRTVLRRHVLPAYGLSPEQLKRHRLEEELAQLPMSQFLGDVPHLLEQLNDEASCGVPSRPVKKSTMVNYRSSLTRFLDWFYSQDRHSTMASSEVGEYAPQIYSGHTITQLRQIYERGTARCTTAPSYALKEEGLTATLQQELQQLEMFMTAPSDLSRHKRPITASTFHLYKANILCFLGWLQQTKADKMEQVELAAMTEPLLLKQFVTWGQQERGNSNGWARNVIKASIAVALWLASSSPQAEQHLSTLKAELKSLMCKHTHNPKVSNVSEHVSYGECIQIVEYLKACCAPRQKSGLLRSEMAVMKAWQRYLIVALLTYTPLRQSEIRVLRRQQSLVRETDGYRVILGDAKVYQKFMLPHHLTNDFDLWFIQFWPKMQIPDNRVFARTGSNNRPECLGEALGLQDISQLVASATYKATSILFERPKRLNAHAFRHARFAYLEKLKHALPSDSVTNSSDDIAQMSLVSSISGSNKRLNS